MVERLGRRRASRKLARKQGAARKAARKSKLSEAGGVAFGSAALDLEAGGGALGAQVVGVRKTTTEAMAMPPPPPDRDLKELIEAKERELADLGDYRLAQLEAGVRDRDRQLDLAAQRLDKLKEDFSYNLSLIAERDAELATLEEERGQLRDGPRRDDRRSSGGRTGTWSRREAYDNSLDLALEDARSAARLEHEAVLRDHARELEALRAASRAPRRARRAAEDLDALAAEARRRRGGEPALRRGGQDAAARYRDLERRHETDVARRTRSRDAQDAFLRSELELKAELSRARTKQDVEDRARVAERDLALATSLLKTRDAGARGGEDATTGGASPFLQGLGSVESRFSGGGGGASSATEARQREIIATMRGDLEQIRTTPRRAARDEEVAVLKERERQNDAARKDAAIAVARRPARRPPAPDDDDDDVAASASARELASLKAQLAARDAPRRPAAPKARAKASQAKAASKLAKPKIRNYNDRD
ncbi:hypothetical protein JL720_11270 [Aureococcus anophagefferens]|nr:hypothetical protein JL720_11270 [Aureococcus anophagefferens]